MSTFFGTGITEMLMFSSADDRAESHEELINKMHRKARILLKFLQIRKKCPDLIIVVLLIRKVVPVFLIDLPYCSKEVFVVYLPERAFVPGPVIIQFANL